MHLKCVSVLLICVIVVIAEKPKVSVYYEALCGDSRMFYTKQFYPAYNKLRDYFTVDLVPYGKATHSLINNNTWNFKCQHGPYECHGNKIQACILKTTNITEQQKLKFINCIFMDYNVITAGPKCAKLSDMNYQSIIECSRSKETDNYLVEYGDRTHALVPHIPFVPTIVFDDVYREDLQNRYLDKFQDMLCSKLGNPKPSACE